MDDLLKSMKAQLYDRVSSPLFFSFAISWCAWNYRYILILLSSMSPADKFLAVDMLDIKFPTSWMYWVCYGFLFPTLTSLTYLFVYPWPAKFVYRYVREEQKKLKEIQTQIDDDTPLTIEEARELRKQIREIVKEHEAEIKDKEEIIARLMTEAESRSHIDAAKGKLADSSNDKKKKKVLPPEQARLLEKIAESNDGLQRRKLMPTDGQDRVKIEYSIDQLLQFGFINEHYTVSGDSFFKVTPNGRAYLIESVIGM